jgi:hypothetical protein
MQLVEEIVSLSGGRLDRSCREVREMIGVEFNGNASPLNHSRARMIFHKTVGDADVARESGGLQIVSR